MLGTRRGGFWKGELTPAPSRYSSPFNGSDGKRRESCEIPLTEAPGPEEEESESSQNERGRERSTCSIRGRERRTASENDQARAGDHESARGSSRSSTPGGRISLEVEGSHLQPFEEQEERQLTPPCDSLPLPGDGQVRRQSPMMVGVNPCGVHATRSNVRTGEIADGQLIKHSPLTTVGVNPCGVHFSSSEVRKNKTGDGQVSSHSPMTTLGVNPCGVHVASSKVRKKETGNGQAMRYSPLEVGVNPCGGKYLLHVSSSEVGRSEIESGVPDAVSLPSVPAGDGFLTDES